MARAEFAFRRSKLKTGDTVKVKPARKEHKWTGVVGVVERVVNRQYISGTQWLVTVRFPKGELRTFRRSFLEVLVNVEVAE